MLEISFMTLELLFAAVWLLIRLVVSATILWGRSVKWLRIFQRVKWTRFWSSAEKQ